MDRDLYLPIAFVEALGRATVARSQLDLALGVLISILATESARARRHHPRDPLETKVDFLESISRSRLLNQEWQLTLRNIASRADELNQQYLSAASGSIYTRGAGSFEEILRSLAQKVNFAPPAFNMTPAKTDEVGRGFLEQARAACSLAESLLEAAETLAATAGEK